jgi:hypothetical protein
MQLHPAFVIWINDQLHQQYLMSEQDKCIHHSKKYIKFRGETVQSWGFIVLHIFCRALMHSSLEKRKNYEYTTVKII